MASSNPYHVVDTVARRGALFGGDFSGRAKIDGRDSQAATAHIAQITAALRLTVRKSNASYSQPPNTGPSTEPMAVATCKRAIKAPRSVFPTREPP